jgi:hypothetical protein
MERVALGPDEAQLDPFYRYQRDKIKTQHLTEGVSMKLLN